MDLRSLANAFPPDPVTARAAGDDEYLIAGNSTYATTVKIVLDDVVVDGTTATLKGHIYLTHNSYYGDGGPFYPSLDLEWTIDGELVWKDYGGNWMLDRDIRFDVTVNDISPGDHTATFSLVNAREICSDNLCSKVVWDDAPGEQSVSAQFTIEEPFDPSLVTVTDCPSLSPDTGIPSESFEATANVENQNSVPADATVAVSAGGTTLATTTVTIPANDSVTKTISFIPGLSPDQSYSVSADVTSASQG